MKNTGLLIVLLFIFLFSNLSIAQFDMHLVDLKTKQTVAYNEIESIYKLDANKPTVIITWSGVWCIPCIGLINRYHECDLSMINLITVNIDTEESYDTVMDRNYQKNWPNSYNFSGNIGDDRKGFDNIFNVSSAPLVTIMKGKEILASTISYELSPFQIVSAFNSEEDYLKFIWNSSKDLNSTAWAYYKSSDDILVLNKAITWIKRSIEIEKGYSNTDTFAALLYKTGKYTEALKKAKEAIEIAKINEQKYDGTNELIQLIIEQL